SRLTSARSSGATVSVSGLMEWSRIRKISTTATKPQEITSRKDRLIGSKLRLPCFRSRAMALLHPDQAQVLFACLQLVTQGEAGIGLQSRAVVQNFCEAFSTDTPFASLTFDDQATALRRGPGQHAVAFRAVFWLTQHQALLRQGIGCSADEDMAGPWCDGRWPAHGSQRQAGDELYLLGAAADLGQLAQEGFENGVLLHWQEAGQPAGEAGQLQ